MLPPFPPSDAHPLEVLLYFLRYMRSANGEEKCYLQLDSFEDVTWIRFPNIPWGEKDLCGPYTLMNELQERLGILHHFHKVYTTVSIMTGHIEHLWGEVGKNSGIISPKNLISNENEDDDDEDENEADNSLELDDDEDDEERIMRSLDSGDGDLYGY